MKNLILVVSFLSFCSIFAIEKKVKFFKIELEAPIRSSVTTDMNMYYTLDKMFYYPKYYNVLSTSNKGASQESNLYTFQLDQKQKSHNKILVEYYKINKAFRFKDKFKDYNFLIGFSRDSKKVKVNSFYSGNVLSSHWGNLSSRTLAGDGSRDSSKDASSFLGLLNIKYQDIFFGVPLYESKTRFVIIPKLMKRKYQHQLTQRFLSTPFLAIFEDKSAIFSSETLNSKADMNYFGVSIESPESKERYKLFLDYFITNSFSKGSYNKQTFESISYQKVFLGNGLNSRTVSIDGRSIGLERGDFFVSGTRAAFGISYQKSNSLSFYLKKYEEVFEQFYKPKFELEQVTLYGSRDNIDESFIYPSNDTISEYISDLAIYKYKTQIKIEDYRFGVSYKL